MTKYNLEKPEAVFYRVPQIEDICLEFGIERTDALTITCMYELFKRVTVKDHVDWDDEAYNEGYNEGYNDAIDEANSKIEEITWELERLKK